jgi:hypothetical protein
MRVPTLLFKFLKDISDNDAWKNLNKNSRELMDDRGL